MEDGEIVDLFLARNETAIKETSEKYGEKLRFIAYRVCNDMSTAEECENDTYLKAWNSIPPYTPRAYLFSFLAKIARCTAIDRLKKITVQKRNAQVLELTRELECCIPSAVDIEAELDEKVLSKAVSDFLRTLSEEKRNIFLRRYWFLDTVADISKRYKITEGKVKSVLFRTRNALRTYLEEEGFI